MALQSSGAISINDIAIEFSCAKDMLSCANAAGLSTTNISLSSFYGLSAYTALGISVPDKNAFQLGSNNDYITMTSTVTNGNGSHTYSWVKLSGASSISVSGSSTGSTCSILCTTPSSSGTDSAVIQCTVSDGQSSASSTGTATFSWEP